MIKKWEYKLLEFGLKDRDSRENTLNRLGEEGWELVAMTAGYYDDGSGPRSSEACFKKEKS